MESSIKKDAWIKRSSHAISAPVHNEPQVPCRLQSHSTPMRFPNITLVCVDGRSLSLGLGAIHDSTVRVNCEFARNLVVTSPNAMITDSSNPVSDQTQVIPVNGLDSIEGYNEFLLKGLNGFVETDFALIVQWDGFVLNGSNWRAEFLEYDYVGALWPWQPPGYRVGNGGFSLRSKRLLRALQDFRVVVHHPEDLAICQTYRDFLEKEFLIRFASADIANAFSFERCPHGNSFGFHGFYNLHRVFSEDELNTRLAELPTSVFGSNDAVELAHNLISTGNARSARTVLAKYLRYRHASEMPGDFHAK